MPGSSLGFFFRAAPDNAGHIGLALFLLLEEGVVVIVAVRNVFVIADSPDDLVGGGLLGLRSLIEADDVGICRHGRIGFDHLGLFLLGRCRARAPPR